MNQEVQNAINEQINAEIYSSYLYLAMAAYFDGKGLEGFSNWMKVQAQEELTHAMKFYRYVYERGGEVILQSIEKPKTEFDSPLAVAKEVLEHEKKVTALINDIYTLALDEKDYATQSMLKWFIDEQVEEEAAAQQIIDKLEVTGEKGQGLYMLDKELASRTFVDETQESE
jgi:ferritin